MKSEMEKKDNLIFQARNVIHQLEENSLNIQKNNSVEVQLNFLFFFFFNLFLERGCE